MFLYRRVLAIIPCGYYTTMQYITIGGISLKNQILYKKILSIFLTFIVLILSVPVAFAASETLSASNVTKWPTISYNNPDGKMYYGQTLAEGLTLNDDEIVLDAAGNQVPGHFEFVDPSLMQSYATNAKANLTFVPDNTDAYTGFTKKRSTVTYNVQKTTLVLADENNPPVAASQIVKGATLSTVEITGGQVKNPYNATESNAAGAYWEWVNPDTVVTESGEYEAKVHTVSSYEEFIVKVYVEVESSIEATTIVEAPTATLEYGQYFSEAVFEGGKVMAGDTEVSGTFTRKSTSAVKPIVGVFDAVEVIFTPDDLEKYAPCEGTAVVTVTKANYKFVNENGEEIVPELTLPYGTTFDQHEILGNSLKDLIKDRAQLSGVDIIGSLIFEAGDKDTVAPVGTNTYNVRVRPYNSGTSNYNVTDLQFILTIEPVIITTTASWGTDGVIKGKLSHDTKGTLDIFVDGKLVADDITAGGADNEWSVDYPIPATGDYTIKVVYNPTENDPYSMVDFEKVVTAKIRRSITYADATAVNHKINGDERTPIAKLGDTIELSTFGGVAFLGWKITDMNGNEVDLGIADLMATEITFTMPDCDLFVEAMYQKDEPADDNNGLGGIFGDLDLGDLTEGDSESKLVNIINNIIALFRNIIEKITGFFRAIGDAT